MNRELIRRKIFLNSQYNFYYIEKNSTVFRGVLKDLGYLYNEEMTEDKINKVSCLYSKMYNLLIALIAIELILYIYFIVFPFYIDFMSYSVVLFVLIFSIIPIVALYLTNIFVNGLYENSLKKLLGNYRKVKYNSNLKNFNELTYKKYLKTEKKSVYIMLLIALIFFSYVFTPSIVKSLINVGKYNTASKISSVYLKFVPVSSDVYSARGYAQYKLKKYKEAAADYEKANIYTFSNSFANDILASKINYLSYDEMIKEFNKVISVEDDKLIRSRLLYEKANYEFEHQKYKESIETYNSLLSTYKSGKNVHYRPEIAFYNRAKAKLLTGDKKGALEDYKIVNTICPKCSFEYKSTLRPRAL